MTRGETTTLKIVGTAAALVVMPLLALSPASAAERHTTARAMHAMHRTHHAHHMAMMRNSYARMGADVAYQDEPGYVAPAPAYQWGAPGYAYNDGPFAYEPPHVEDYNVGGYIGVYTPRIEP